MTLPFVTFTFWLIGASDSMLNVLVVGVMCWFARNYLSKRLAGKSTWVVEGVTVEASDSPGTKVQSDTVALFILIVAIALLMHELLKVIHTP